MENFVFLSMAVCGIYYIQYIYLSVSAVHSYTEEYAEDFNGLVFRTLKV